MPSLPSALPAALLPAVAFALAAAAGLLAYLAPRRGGAVALAAVALMSGAFVAAAAAGTEPTSLAWIPDWQTTLVFRLDGLAVAYAGLTLAIAVAVFTYAPVYMRHHVEGHPRQAARLPSFFLLMTVFVAAMIGLVTSFDLLQLFVFWDITAICSYLLIGFDAHDRSVRRAALMALLVTGISAVLLLFAVAVFQARYGTAEITRLAALVAPDPVTTLACAALVVAALAKSAQWPLHFWLPEAMAAPTPVSAYLHAAAMVAAGVFLLQRLQPVLEVVPAMGPSLIALGWLSMAAGGILALGAGTLKRILAYSTIAQYGHVVFLIGSGGGHAAAAATFFVLAHGLCKSALFLAAGAVTMATGESELSRLGGLRRRLPVLAAVTGVAAAGLAGAPLTIGFFKDEALFGVAAARGWGMLALAVCGPALTIAYMWRFWRGIFLGATRSSVRPVPAPMLGAIAALAAAVAVFGLAGEPLAAVARQAAAGAGASELSAGYHIDIRPTNLAALTSLLLALPIIAITARRRENRLAGRFPGPLQLYGLALRAAARAGRLLRGLFPRSLRVRLAVIFISALALVLLGQLSVGLRAPAATWTAQDVPIAAALLLTVAAALATVTNRQHVVATLGLSVTTLGLAAVFAMIGAPDVALVLVVINVATSLLLLALLHRLPGQALAVQRDAPPLWRWKGEDELLGLMAGALALLVATGTFGTPPPADVVPAAYVDLAERAHARNVVSAILVDFRGLDTLGEVTVVVISLVATDALMRRRASDE